MPDLSLPGQNPPPLFFPPFPNEEKMRRGRLNAEAPLGLLGETHSVGRRKYPVSIVFVKC
jgi:mediator of RNA polymerase II transcription subunit 4